MTYLISSSLCLLAFWLFYKLALENLSWHRFKRFYLLAILILAAIIPLIVVKTTYLELQPQSFMDFSASSSSSVPTALYPVSTEQVVPVEDFDWMNVLWLVYAAGILIMSNRFAKNLWNLKINAGDKVTTWNDYLLVRKEKLDVPCSFLNRIYIPAQREVPSHILDHEKAHLDQRHSWDIIAIELLLIIMWFHPLIYLMKYSIKLNHEFLADEAVLKHNFNLNDYQKSLLEFMTATSSKVAHTFNFPLIKKRFQIMNTKTSTYNGLLRSLAVIPVLAFLIISCGKEKEEVVAQSNDGFLSNKQYDYVINPYEKKGTVTFQNSNYTYLLKDDYSVTLIGAQGDTINNTNPFLAWNTEKEWSKISKEIARLNILRENLTINVFDYNIPPSKHTEPDKKVKEINHMLNFIKEEGFDKVGVAKYFNDNVEHISFYRSHVITLKKCASIINKTTTATYIDNNSTSGTITIEGASYTYTNVEKGIKIFDKNGEEINWYEKGWDIRERLVVPKKEELNALFKILHGFDKSDKIFIDGKQITKAAYEKIKHMTADSMSVKTVYGNKHVYLYGVSSARTAVSKRNSIGF